MSEPRTFDERLQEKLDELARVQAAAALQRRKEWEDMVAESREMDRRLRESEKELEKARIEADESKRAADAALARVVEMRNAQIDKAYPQF